MRDARARLAVALDLPDRAALLALARRVGPEAGVLKLGLEAFVAEGPSLVSEVAASSAGVFLDLKLHDIPNTVGRAAAAAVLTGASI
ncbi:MAG TPA: orotidine 5'-phosphate decarboxylase / HUMPS family protein, partial [Thermoanaerobaculia bacterium]|nr:orotidine 5'-phosphate decarboxylase / HUMPS family protein [Thermoanaerobaculia bacterium]